jgi:hypothetical protein|tara:strand:- start:2444 stop:2671 length:228 start_codon:yes stop_codon:yes gene_type:complete
MPTKFRPSQTVYIKKTGKKETTHFYIKQISKEELFKEINAENPKKKLRAKCIREIERRGLKINWVPRTKEEASLV